jgi:hypothetical protein
LQRLELVQVADARVGHHRHGAGDGAAGGAQPVVEQAVFFGQAVLPPHGQRGHGGHAGQRLQHLRPGCQQGRVAPELVEHKTADQPPLRRRQQRPGAEKVGKRAAPVNVGHQKAPGLGVLGHPPLTMSQSIN